MYHQCTSRAQYYTIPWTTQNSVSPYKEYTNCVGIKVWRGSSFSPLAIASSSLHPISLHLVSPNGLLSGVTSFRLLCSWSTSGASLFVCVFADSLPVTAMASDNATGAPTAKEGDNNKVTGAPSARGGDKHNLHATCCGLYKFGGPGVVHDPVANERALRAVSLIFKLICDGTLKRMNVALPRSSKCESLLHGQSAKCPSPNEGMPMMEECVRF